MQGEVPVGWRREPLGQLGQFLKCQGGSKKDEVSAGVPVVRYGQIYTRYDTVIRSFYSFVSDRRASDYTPLKSGDVLFAGSGETLDEIGKAAVFLGQGPAHGSGDLILLRPSPAVDPLFLGYSVNSGDANGQKMRLGQGSSVFHISADRLAGLRIHVPPLSEQKKIAAILSSVDEAIQATQAVIDQTRRVKEGLLQDLLTRGIGHTRFKQTGIGEIPEGWGVVDLRTLVLDERPICYGILKPGGSVPGGVPVVKVKNIFGGQIDDTDLLLTDPVIDAAYRRSKLRPGDVLVTIRGSTGRVAVVPESLADANITQDTARLSINPERAHRLFVYFALQSRRLQRHIDRHTIGQAVKGINIAEVRKVPLVLPSLAEQGLIVDVLSSNEDQIRRGMKTLSGLVATKAGLLQDLLTGHVRVTP